MPIFIQLTDRDDRPVWINFQWVNQMFVRNDYTVVSFNGGDEDVHVKETPQDILMAVSSTKTISLN